jgi:pimeloyl-CoA synthetase
MSEQVDLLVQQIERLDEADRDLLELKLQEMAEAAWRHEAEFARTVAAQQGITQQTIDRAVEEARYES